MAPVTKKQLEAQNTKLMALCNAQQKEIDKSNEPKTLKALSARAQDRLTGEDEGQQYAEFSDALVAAFQKVINENCCMDISDALDGVMCDLGDSIQSALSDHQAY